jgi:predicted signal transduction protein with EAL and GGDEF domain
VSSESLILAIPDLVAFVRRDGVVTHQLGGRELPFVRERSGLEGARLADALQGVAGTLAARLLRRVFANRAASEAQFAVAGRHYEIRLSPQGRDRALCVVRQAADDAVATDTSAEGVAEGHVERRGFARRLRESVAAATLAERPLALGLVYVEGLADIGRLIDFSVAEQVTATILARLPSPAEADEAPRWYAGLLSEGLFGVVVEGASERERIIRIVRALCESLACPVRIGATEFHLRPHAGVAVLGQDAMQPSLLLQYARAAMLEARRAAHAEVQFYSDTLRLLPVARLDIERELRRAIEQEQIGLRYLARHDLGSGRIVAVHTYVCWIHPLRGEIAPAEFLPIADATGLALALSRAALARLAADAPRLLAQHGADLRLSFGPLRQHVTGGQLAQDCQQWLGRGHVEPARFELRIAERTLAASARPGRQLGELTELGAAVTIDEIGRSFSSVTRLAQLRLAALQIDRAQAVAAAGNDGALRACRALVALARALEMVPIAPGVDDGVARDRLRALGFAEGLGDLYPAVAVDGARTPARRAAG